MSPRLSPPTCVLFYVQHLLGVGHVARAAALARGMTAAGIDLTVLLGGEPVPHMDFGSARVVPLPPIRSADAQFSGLVDADGRPVTAMLWSRRTGQLLAELERTRPDVLLIELYPFGRRKFGIELDPLIAMARQRGAAVACSLRDILVERADPGRSARIAEQVRECFDRVLVHGDGRVIPLAATFSAATAIADLVRYTGYVVDGHGTAPPDGAGTGAGEIVVSTGGGAVGEPLLEATASAAAAGCLAPLRWRLLAGANLPDPVFARLAARAGDRLIVERARPDFRALLARARLSISQAGYNTLMDLLVAGCPALVVPFASGQESEQLQRARLFEKLGAVSVLEERELTPKALAAAAERAVAAGARGLQTSLSIDLDGSAATARLVTEAADEARARRHGDVG